MGRVYRWCWVGLFAAMFLWIAGCFQWSNVEAPAEEGERAAERAWVLEVDEALSWLSSSERPLIWDVRGEEAFVAGHLEGARRVSWQQFSAPQGVDHGELLADRAQLERALQAAGVRGDRGVLVIGDPRQGWGEDGRLVWMLRVLGHPAASFVDGGQPALVRAGVELVEGRQEGFEPGVFVPRVQERWQIEAEELRQLLGREEVVLIDSREPREFAGQTPYGESRGGALPGAVNLYFRDFLDDQGILLSRDTIDEMLAQRGIERGDTLVAYCTGGIRSAWVTAVLWHLGYGDVRNYAGSMWQWSARDPQAYPLVEN